MTALFFQLRSIQSSGWILVDGIITLLLGLMIYLQWPSTVDAVFGGAQGHRSGFSVRRLNGHAAIAWQ